MEAGCVMSSGTGGWGGRGDAGPSGALELVGWGVCDTVVTVSFCKALLARWCTCFSAEAAGMVVAVVNNGGR